MFREHNLLIQNIFLERKQTSTSSVTEETLEVELVETELTFRNKRNGLRQAQLPSREKINSNF